ncbi:acyl-CoA thioesterase [Flagellimonas sp.]|uniref:acyl-CoA thioesterase n=1 Tax=Flagellimonas sp. TaxID=2058762 RepID=UPI003F4A5D39
MQVYEKTLIVQSDDLDELNHVNNIRYIDWVQQISKEHWEKVTTPEIRNELIWVVRKHEVNYFKSAVLHDEIVLRTHIAQNKGPISTRIVEVWDNKANTLLVKASTDWCLLDASTFRPKRVPEHIATLFQ